MSDSVDLDSGIVAGGGSRYWIILLALTAGVLLAAGVVLIKFRDDGTSQKGPLLDLAAVVVDGEEVQGVVHVRLKPAATGKNEVEVDIDPADNSWLSEVEEVSLTLLPYVTDQGAVELDLDLSDDAQRGDREIALDGSQMWEVRVATASPEGKRRLATLVVLLPDPNLYANDAVAMVQTDPDAEEFYQRASTTVSELHRLRYQQQLSDGEGLAVLSYHAVNDGSDGSEPGFTYDTPGGLEAVVKGTTAWTRYPGEEWEVQETNSMIPPSEWGGEYTGATEFQFGPMSEAPGGNCRIVTFVVPATPNRSVAWYAWCIEESTGRLLRDAMISRSHYMITEFSDFDGDVNIVPPDTGDGQAQPSSPVAKAPE